MRLLEHLNGPRESTSKVPTVVNMSTNNSEKGRPFQFSFPSRIVQTGDNQWEIVIGTTFYCNPYTGKPFNHRETAQKVASFYSRHGFFPGLKFRNKRPKQHSP